MKLTILIPYRPTRGSLNSPNVPMYQDRKYLWRNKEGTICNRYFDGQEDILRCVEALRKNSVYVHDIVVALDSDMYPQDGWLKDYGVDVFKSTWAVPDGCESVPPKRLMHTLYDAIHYIPDDAIVAFGYISDLVCGKLWDEPIVEAIDKYGLDYVYTPIFVEPRSIHRSHCWSCGESVRDIVEPMGETTTKNIWETWRGYCCHSLTMRPPIDRNYAIESDLYEWSAVCNAGGKTTIIEPCGVRNYGYWASIVSKNTLLKEHAHELLIGPGGDLAFEGALGTKCVVCRSHVFHLHYRCDLDVE